MIEELCTKIDNCHKIKMVQDKEMSDFQFAECVKSVCGKCDEFSHEAPAPKKDDEGLLENIAIALYFRHKALEVGVKNVIPWHKQPLSETQIYWDDARVAMQYFKKAQQAPTRQERLDKPTSLKEE